jgi:hypothetical protein
VPDQFGFPEKLLAESPLYVNLPSSIIRFVYDGNPRGYFGPSNEVEHVTNSAGFRGGEFRTAKGPDTVRIAFLGDSFTFGEGVRFADTYPEVAAAALQRHFEAARLRFESYNFGVGGYNTTQALQALERWALQGRPDLVVLGYVLNDAEESLFRYDAGSGTVVRRAREIEIPEGLGEPLPPAGALFRSRLAQLAWHWDRTRENRRRMTAFYRALYRDDARGWRETRRALARLGTVCREHELPFYVLCFPILLNLERYPFEDLHARVREEVEAAGGRFVDLLPVMKTRQAAELWVHPVDQHPNETAHRMAGEVLAKRLIGDGVMARLRARD